MDDRIKISLKTLNETFEKDLTAREMRRIAADRPELLGIGANFRPRELQDTYPALKDAIQKSAVPLSDALQLLLILQYPDFYLLQNRTVGSVTAVEISTTAARLQEKTGLTMSSVYRQLGVLCYAVGIMFEALEMPAVALSEPLSTIDFEQRLLQSDTVPAYGYVIPESLYAAERHQMDMLYIEKKYDELLQIAEPLCGMSNPTACYYCGLCYLTGSGVSENIGRAVPLLKLAAQGGEMRAWNALGDYYSSQHCKNVYRMELAYRCYTICGSHAVSSQQKKKITEMVENKAKYKKDIVYAAIFPALMLVFLLIAGITGAFGQLYLGVGIALAVVCLLVYGAFLFLQEKFTHDDFIRHSVPAMYFIWAIYLLVWIFGAGK